MMASRRTEPWDWDISSSRCSRQASRYSPSRTPIRQPSDSCSGGSKRCRWPRSFSRRSAPACSSSGCRSRSGWVSGGPGRGRSRPGSACSRRPSQSGIARRFARRRRPSRDARRPPRRRNADPFVTSPRPSPVVEALSDPAAYPDPVERVELIETHISWVFLAGQWVYKVKKPVDLGFLDFTTLERRRFFCEEEVRLNQRLTRDVYLGVVELTGADRLRIGGPGPVREVAVKMRRLPDDRMLDRLVRDDRAEPALLEA